MSLLDRVSLPFNLRGLKIEDLKVLSGEIREVIIKIASEKGGHLGASLGVVELTIALHYIFNTPEDILIWDVGHQTYPHKILTGRKDLMPTIRQPGGIAGFTKRNESMYDPFGAGHSSTSISAALGFAAARDIKKQNNHVISVIGDGAMSAGMAFEALNNASMFHTKMLVILNDNKMSIAPAVGAMSSYLAKLLSSRQYYKARNIAKNALHYTPFFEKVVKNIQKCTKHLATGSNFFEEIGFHYIGPVDGHNLNQLIPVLRNIRDNDQINKPILLHIMTEKGRGFDSPEKSLESYHAVLPFDLQTKIQKKPEKSYISYSKIFASTLTKIAKQDKEVIAITAAMPSGTGLDLMIKELPEQVYDVGIAEQHAVTFAAGLAACRSKPFVAIYSTFLQRAYDQIVHDVAIQSLPVRFMIDRAGVVGADGPTHAGSFDLSYLCNLPNFICMAPSDEIELSRMVLTAYHINHCPSSVRYPKTETTSIEFNYEPEILKIGKGRIIKKGEKIAILSLGTRLRECIKTSKMLSKDGYDITIADARFAKPLDMELIRDLASSHQILLTVEEGALGGFGSNVAQFLLNEGLLDSKLKFRSLCLPDYFIEQNTVQQMYEEAGLNASNIYQTIKNLLS
ncbi:MAG: 1-deoxy-D-xylulose-5-phosphate synthase [Candidatus Midichloria sp.]|nr:MAG: 1-deoxy-D-xylulose-5-phosphate synthase [Candidatus Midichloria sp.]